MSNDLRRGRQVVSKLHVHLVFVTKYRRNALTKEILTDMNQIFNEVCMKFDAQLMAFEGERDHVHLLIQYEPKTSISSLVNSLKGVSSRLIRKKQYPTITSELWGNAIWSPSYFAASCGGAPLEIVKQYIEQQYTPN